jgi:asparagine synthase (glutamine-hydrolysing)
VRVRYPFLDHPVIELGFRIPASLKLKGSHGLRYIFKRAFAELLPPEILSKKKHGFGLPIAEWLRRDPKIKEFAYNVLFNQKHLQRGYFKPEFVKALWQHQLNDNTPYYGTIVYQMLMLELWHRLHVDS